MSRNDDGHFDRRKSDGTYAKGVSGNLKGRPKGAKNLHTIIRDVLDELVPASKGGRRQKISTKEAVVRSLIVKALTPPGDRQAMINILQLLAQSEEAASRAQLPEYPFEDADREVIAAIHARMKACQEPETP